MPTWSVLCCQCSCHLLPWAVASTEEKRCAGGKEPLGRKCRTPPSGIVLGLSGRVMSLSAVSMPAFKLRVDVAQLPSWSRVCCPQRNCKAHMTLQGGFLKREWQERLPRKLISPCIREVLEPIWSRIRYSAYHWYSITDALIHLQLEAQMAGIHICKVTLCSSIRGAQS